MENNNQTMKHKGLGKWIITAIVVVLVIWALSWIWPGHRPGHRYDRGGHHWMELSQAEMDERMEHGAEWAFKKLDTTDEQEELILDALKDLTPYTLKLQGERLELENKFRSALMENPLDRGTLTELMEEVKDLTARSLDEGMEAFITIWETLTVEQRETLLERWSDKG